MYFTPHSGLTVKEGYWNGIKVYVCVCVLAWVCV